MSKMDELAEMINFLAAEARRFEEAGDFAQADFYHTGVANAAAEFAAMAA